MQHSRMFIILTATLTAVSVAAIPLSTTSAASMEKVLHRFRGRDGAFSQAGLVLDGTGNLYGTTSQGGTSKQGTVFEVSPIGNGHWTEKVLYSFGGRDGANPKADLILDAAGNLYGTTAQGGASGSGCGGLGCGTVFELSPGSNGQWTETVLHSFAGSPTDGGTPVAGLTFDGSGNLYGTTSIGGLSDRGTVFQLSPANGTWNETLLHIFPQYVGDGDGPRAGLIFDKMGNLYGTTYRGGTARRSGLGTVFELSPAGNGQWTESVLHSFNYPDGYFPLGGLVLDMAGNLYGTTTLGGNPPNSQTGTVFRLKPSGNGQWTIKVLHNFQLNGKDGESPHAGLTFDAAGNLYGTGQYGWNHGCCGTVFKLTLNAKGSWTFKVLHTFLRTNGAIPLDDVVFDTFGNLYGTTSQGGDKNGNGLGTVFEITP